MGPDPPFQRNLDCTIWSSKVGGVMANSGNPAGPFIIWRNPAKTWAPKADWFTSRVDQDSYEVRQQLESGRWALIAVFTVLRRAA